MANLSRLELLIIKDEYVKAIHAGKQLLAIDPYKEEVYRIVMQIYKGMEKRDEALRLYQQLIVALQELQVVPSEESKKVYEEIYK